MTFLVSIHAPTWGATIYYCHCTAVAYCFNPRAHVGRDVGQVNKINKLFVSIHAPTWGATRNI